MAAETASIREKTRRVKDHILTRYLALADTVNEGKSLTGKNKELYDELTAIFAKSVLPRSVEHGGDPDNTTPIPILSSFNVHPHNGDQKDRQPQEENPSSPGRDISVQDNLDTSTSDQSSTAGQSPELNVHS